MGGFYSSPSKPITHKDLMMELLSIECIDTVISEMNEIIKGAGEIVETIENNHIKIKETLGYKKNENVEIKQAFIALMLHFLACIDGDYKLIKFKVGINPDAKNIDEIFEFHIGSKNTFLDKTEDYILAFKNYVEYLVMKAINDMNSVAEKVAGLQDKIKDAGTKASAAIQEKAENDPMGAMKAASKLKEIMSKMMQVPAFIKQLVDSLQEKAKHLEELLHIYNDLEKLSVNGKACKEAKKFSPVEAYAFIYPKEIEVKKQ